MLKSCSFVLSLAAVIGTLVLGPVERKILLTDAIRCSDQHLATDIAKKIQAALTAHDEIAADAIFAASGLLCEYTNDPGPNVSPLAWVVDALYESSTTFRDKKVIIRLLRIPPVEGYGTTYLILIGEDTSQDLTQRTPESPRELSRGCFFSTNCRCTGHRSTGAGRMSTACAHYNQTIGRAVGRGGHNRPSAARHTHIPRYIRTIGQDN